MRDLRRRRAGATLLELLIVLEVLSIIFAMAIPNLLISRQSANESSCAESLKLITEAEANYRTGHGVYGTLGNLQASGMLDSSIANATSTLVTRSGYYFSANVVAANKNQYYVNALPAGAGGGHVLYTDESGLLFSAPAGTTAPSADAGGSLTTLGSAWSAVGN